MNMDIEAAVDAIILRDAQGFDEVPGIMNALNKAIVFAEWGWTIIANAHGGNWELESKGWQEAAAKYRDQFHNEIRHLADVKISKDNLSGKWDFSIQKDQLPELPTDLVQHAVNLDKKLGTQPKPESWQEIAREAVHEIDGGAIVMGLTTAEFDDIHRIILKVIKRSHAAQPQRSDQQALKDELLRRGLDADKTTLEIEAKINRHIEKQALPCPFCGSDEIQLCPIADGSWTLDCHTCGAGCGTNDKEFVLAAWNKRAAQPKPESWQEIAEQHTCMIEKGLETDGPPFDNWERSQVKSFVYEAIERSHAAQPQRSDPPVDLAPEWVKEIERSELNPHEYAKRVMGTFSDQPSSAKATDDKQNIGREIASSFVYGVYKWRGMSAAFMQKQIGRLAEPINAALAAERQRREQAERSAEAWEQDAKRYAANAYNCKQQLLSALAAIEVHNKDHEPRWCSEIKVDLSALREHDAEIYKLAVADGDAQLQRVLDRLTKEHDAMVCKPLVDLICEIAQESAVEARLRKYVVVQMTPSTWDKLQSNYDALAKARDVR